MIDINCDLGEGEPAATTRALMRQVTSANIACGGHAGDAGSMLKCLRLCHELGVRAGAHPGLFDRENFGRIERALGVEELRTLLTQQAGALALLAGHESVPLTHIKLHGALYHMAETSSALARTYVEWVKEYLPGLEIYGLPGGQAEKLARKNGVGFRGEIYADRAYGRDGKLVARTRAGAVLEDMDLIAARMKGWLETGKIAAIDGTKLPIAAETVCLHSDSPLAVGVAKKLRGL